MENYSAKEQSSANAPMEQVREILFGAQLKDMEIRFKRQEERFIQEISDIRDSFKKRLDSLENFMRSEAAGLLDRLKRETEEREATLKAEQRERSEALAAEQRERQEAIKEEKRERQEAVKNEDRERQEASGRLASDLSGAVEAFERKLGKLTGTLDAAERDLRSLLLNESGSLNEKIDKKYADALKALARTNAQIRNDMVYRAALSGLFAESVGALAQPWNPEALGEAAAETKDVPREVPEEGAVELPQVAQMGSADSY